MTENLNLIIALLALTSIGASGAMLGMAWYELASWSRYKGEARHG